MLTEEERMEKYECPICEEGVNSDECMMISFYAEGILPEEDVPEFITPEHIVENKDTCMNCQWHPY